MGGPIKGRGSEIRINRQLNRLATKPPVIKARLIERKGGESTSRNNELERSGNLLKQPCERTGNGRDNSINSWNFRSKLAHRFVYEGIGKGACLEPLIT